MVRAEAIEKAGDKNRDQNDLWFAKNVGMVKQVVTIDELRIVART